MPLSIRVDLTVPYARKEEAKALGARWDGDKRTWFAPAGTDLQGFDQRWLPKNCEIDAEPGSSSTTIGTDSGPEKGVSLTDLLNRVKGVIQEGLPDAVWVRAEISELRGKNGHLYPTLTERDERGEILAQCKGAIWKSRAEPITAKFEEVTGEGLKKDIKILCLAKVRYDPLYGLDLIIEDVDPSHTLGDLAAKLARIREWLVKDGSYERNRGLPAPVEFVRVAVISPETLALLARHQIPLLRTDEDGTVTVVSDGKTWGESVSGKSPRGPPGRDDRVAVATHKSKPAGASKSPSRIIDINTASQKELEALLGIGPVIAQRIIEGRPYGAVDDLRRVKGIGEKRMAEIRCLVGAR